jgi:hypothetical protein
MPLGKSRAMQLIFFDEAALMPSRQRFATTESLQESWLISRDDILAPMLRLGVVWLAALAPNLPQRLFF